jgi:hypothetical protein
MAQPPLYLSLSDLKVAIQIPDGLTDTDLLRALGAASRAVEQATGRRFWLDEDSSTRRYTATSSSLVLVDDVAEIDSVTSNGTAVDWFPGPANADAELEPFVWIESDGAFSKARGAIEVTGRFGWPEVPEQIPQIVLVLATKLFKRSREAPFGIVGSNSIDGTSLRITRDDPDMKLLIEPFRRAETPSHG